MKQLLLLSFLLLSIPSVNSQQLFFETGKTISSFDYKNSSGENLDNIYSSNFTYLSLGYRTSVLFNNLYLNMNASYNTYGAIGSDRGLDNYFEWNLSYIGTGLGFDYELYAPGNFIFFIKGTANVEFLVQGTQTINNQVYNLYNEKDFNGVMFAVRPGLGLQYKISENLTVFSQYSYGVSNTFKNISGNLKIKTDNFGLGVFLNISKKASTETTKYKAEVEQLKMALDVQAQKIQTLEENSIKLEALKKDVVEKNNEFKSLKTAIYKALFPYSGSDLDIKDFEGKVYVTLENDIIFNSGSSKLNSKGKKTIQDFGKVLANNPDLSVLIEGHTDNVPFKDANITNRDLSLKRAMAIVDLLSKNKNISPKNLVAAGIGEFDPIEDNSTDTGRVKNRRIEIVLTPKFKKLIELIKN